MQVLVDGLMTYYSRSGKGKTVVLLHGWGDSAATYKRLAATLSSAYDVVVPDLPGFGKTDAPKGSWTLDDYALFVAAFLRKIGVKEVDVIAGHSNGGAIALRGLATKELDAGKLVLLASAGIRGEYKGRKKALRLITKAGKVLTTPLPKSAKKHLRKAVYKSVGSDMLVAEHLQETFKNVVGDDVQTDAAKIKVPTLLIYGDRDTATPVRYGERFRDLLSKSNLEVVVGAGHFVHTDKPDTVERLIVEFIR